MKTQTIGYLMLGLVLLVAIIGFVWLEKGAREGQATKTITKGYPVAQPGKNIIQVQTQSGYPSQPQKRVVQVPQKSVPTRVQTTHVTSTSQTRVQTNCGTCRKWAACAPNVDQLMVEGKPGQCIDAYKAASAGIPYCGKTANGQNCDPYGAKRMQCVCRQ